MKRKIFLIAIISTLSISAIVGVTFGTIFWRKDSTTDQIKHTVAFNSNGGTQIQTISVNEGEKIAKPVDPIKKGYSLKDWNYGGKPWFFDSYVVRNDMVLDAEWDYVNYTISYNFNGGYSDELYETTYNIDSEFDLIRPEKNESVFCGWFDSRGHRIDDIHEGMTGNISLTARWIDNLVIISEDITKGEIYVYGDEEDSKKVTVKNIPVDNKYHLFKGWVSPDNPDDILSDDTSYTFYLNDDVTTTICSRYLTGEEENAWNLEHGVIPSFTNPNKSLGINTLVKYGMYPQDNINDEELISKISCTERTKYNNYYYYNHEYYTKSTAQLYVDEHGSQLSIRTFDNGDEFFNGITYWFKVQPIIWKVIDNSETSLTLLSQVTTETVKHHAGYDNQIDETGHTIYPNNYEFSNARQWLNKYFLNNTFAFDNSYIQYSEIDNSAETTINPNNKYACSNTRDKVFILSYKDYVTEKYGFEPFLNSNSNSETRQLKSSDFFRANKGQYGTTTKDMFSSYLWTRSPASDRVSITKINRSGGLNSSDGASSYCGLQPAITISRF